MSAATLESDRLPMETEHDAELQVVARGKFLNFVRLGRWEFVTRTNVGGIVVVVPLTRGGEIVFVEQYRPPIARRMIEFPGGIVGDTAETRGEPLESAARRELLEEAGYVAGQLIPSIHGPPSAGLTDEEITFFIGLDCQRVSSGGGDESEDIQVHVVPRGEVDAWLAEQANAGTAIDLKIYAGLYALLAHDGKADANTNGKK